MFFRIIVCAFWVVSFQSIIAQSVGIGTTNPDPSALLDISSTTKGFLIPRMSLAQRNAIANPIQGLQVFVNSDSSLYIYKGTNWSKVQTGGEGWAVQGNKLFNTNAGYVGIGTNAPKGDLHVKSVNHSNNGVDQQQLSGGSLSSNLTHWQSFTAGVTGTLTKVDLIVNSPLSGTSSPGTINIYEGEGTSGTLLSSTSVTYQPVTYTFQSFILSGIANVVAGNQYTIQFSAPSANTGWAYYSVTFPYPGGISDLSASYDYCFKTYVSPQVDAIVTLDGKIGIGTALPGAKLEVQGKVKIADASQGTGKVLTSDANGLASWATIPTQIANGSAAGNTLYWDGTSWVTNSNNIFNNGANVGIGTSTPTNKLSVKGSLDISNRLGIGTTSPSGDLHIKSINNSGNTIDQQQTTAGFGGGGTSKWQSFTAGITGVLTRVDLQVASPINSNPSEGTLKIYAGEGVSGTLLSTTPVIFNWVFNTFQQYAISGLPNVIAGNKYTIQFTVPFANIGWVDYANNNPYAAGRSDQDLNHDYCFKTYVSTVLEAIVADGKVGIGTASPTAKLDINGNVKIADGTQGLGKVLTSDANGLTSWTTPVILNGTAPGNTPFWNGTSWVSNSSNIYNNGAKVGIATTSPKGVFHVKSISSGSSTVDQQQTSIPLYGGGTTQWQSFTAGTTGTLSKIDLYILSPTDPDPAPGTIKIYAGEGTSGSLLSTTNVMYESPAAFQSFILSTPVNVISGSKYTIEFTTPTVANGWMYFSSSNPYAGGRASWDANSDAAFKTYISTNSIDALVVYDGNIGINTAAPTATLSVNGTANNTTGSWDVFSDSRIKSINSPFTDGLNVINKINPIKFNYKTNAPFKADREQIGIIAQELEKIAPYMVSQREFNDIKDLREVNNQAYVFLLINAVKELSAQNEKLSHQNDELKLQYTGLRSELEWIKSKMGVASQASTR